MIYLSHIHSIFNISIWLKTDWMFPYCWKTSLLQIVEIDTFLQAASILMNLPFRKNKLIHSRMFNSYTRGAINTRISQYYSALCHNFVMCSVLCVVSISCIHAWEWRVLTFLGLWIFFFVTSWMLNVLPSFNTDWTQDQFFVSSLVDFSRYATCSSSLAVLGFLDGMSDFFWDRWVDKGTPFRV